MTHNTSAPVADKALDEQLAYWRGLELECEALRAGRGFRLEEALGEAHRSGQLITLAEAQEMVAAAERRIWAEADETIAIMREQFNSGNARFCAGIELEDLPAIRAAATGTKEGE